MSDGSIHLMGKWLQNWHSMSENLVNLVLKSEQVFTKFHGKVIFIERKIVDRQTQTMPLKLFLQNGLYHLSNLNNDRILTVLQK